MSVEKNPPLETSCVESSTDADLFGSSAASLLIEPLILLQERQS